MTQSYKMEDAHKLELQLDKHNGTKIFMKSHHRICLETLCTANLGVQKRNMGGNRLDWLCYQSVNVEKSLWYSQYVLPKTIVKRTKKNS